MHKVIHFIHKVKTYPCVTASILGALLNLALPPFYILPFLPISIAGLLYILEAAQTKRQAFMLGWLFTFCHFVVGFYWFIPTLLVDAEDFAWMIPFSVLAVAIYSICYGSITLAAHMVKPNRLAQCAIFTILWGLAELFRSYYLFPLPWNLIGYSFALSDTLMQVTALIGIYGLGLVVVFISTLFYVGNRKAYSTIAVISGLVITFGIFRLDGAVDNGFYENIKLRLVQPAITMQEKMAPNNDVVILKRVIDLSFSPGFENVTHIIWPEGALPFALKKGSVWPDSLKGIAPPNGLLIVGADREEGQLPGKYQRWNTMMVIDGNGSFVDYYDKYHLVPYGEYIPFRKWMPFIETLTGGPTFISQGEGVKTISAGSLPPFSPLICYDAVFSLDVADKNNPPAWLLNITNDAWFGNTTAPHQHFVQAKTRAIEYGIPLVRVANTGISAVVDPYGRVIQKLGLWQHGVIDTNLPKPLPEGTLYAKYQILILSGMFIGLIIVFIVLIYNLKLNKEVSIRLGISK